MKVSIHVNGITVETKDSSDLDGLKEELAVLAAQAPALFESAYAVRSAGYAKDDSSGSKQSKPPVKQAGEPGAGQSDVPKCGCGIAMNDVRGQVYKGGAKKGEPYPNDFYPAKDCTKTNDACKAR